MTNNPEEIRRDIERTRRELSNDVDALTEKVSPSRVVERRVERARGAVTSVKEKVMGTTSDTTGSAKDTMSSAASSVSDAASSVADTASAAPQMARQRTQGNPLAAGLIAFGAGWLISSILPASEKEQQAAAAIKDKATEHSDKITGPLSQAAHEVTDNLREPAQQATESVKSTAADAVSTVKDETQAATVDVTDQAKHSKEKVSNTAGSDNGSSADAGTTPYGGSTYGS
jgi:uncharacterized protein YjbJ (UPF0337 family)